MGGGSSKEEDIDTFRVTVQQHLGASVDRHCSINQTCAQNIRMENFNIIAKNDCQVNIGNICETSTSSCAPGADGEDNFPWGGDDGLAQMLANLQDTEIRDEIAKEINIDGDIEHHTNTEIALKMKESCAVNQSSYQDLELRNANIVCYDNAMIQMINSANHTATCASTTVDKVLDKVKERRDKEGKKGGLSDKNKQHIAVGIGAIMLVAFLLKPKRKRLLLDDDF